MSGKIHIGTSGWSYKHWRNSFYPEEMKAGDYLAYYRQHFETTEINTSFYHLPKTATVSNWINTVKRGFLFCPKMSRYITHVKKLNDPDQSLPRFFEVFDPFQKKLGPVLIQLPPNLAFHEEKVTHFFKVLKQYKGYRFAIEPRHNSWFTEEVFNIIRKYKVAFVIADAGQRWPTASAVTNKHIYIRLHGKEGYDSAYTGKFLSNYAKQLLQWKADGHTIWVFFNNDGNTNAIYNALKLSAFINGQKNTQKTKKGSGR